jgi:hypothetical protein
VVVVEEMLVVVVRTTKRIYARARMGWSKVEEDEEEADRSGGRGRRREDQGGKVFEDGLMRRLGHDTQERQTGM